MKVEICNKKNDKLVLDYVVIFAKYKEQWILVRHRDRNTWEFPGGKIEHGENALCAAKRELFEETGATEYTINEFVEFNVIVNGRNSYGRVYVSIITCLGIKPCSEIEEIKMTSYLNHKLTHPQIYEVLINYLKK